TSVAPLLPLTNISFYIKSTKKLTLPQGLKDTVETILGVPYIKFNIVFRYDINSYKNFPPE
ncbi:MAG: hypothetical protein L6Q94_19925, partial [Calditrichia bacterium]|nr:hypothetical protein [Calditrichia bacterium]